MHEIYSRERDRYLCGQDDATGQQPVEKIDQVQVVRASEGHGSSRAANEYGGLVECEVHLDGLVMAPTLELDGRPVIVDGRHAEELAA